MYLKIELSIKHPDNRVEYELWFSSVFDMDRKMLADLGIFQRMLGKDALFTPRLYTYECQDSVFCDDDFR